MNRYEQIGINTKKLIDATEWFTTLMYYLYEERGYENLELKIGTFNYDDEWIGDIYCILVEDIEDNLADIFFRIIRYDFGESGRIKRLTDLSFGWEFERSTININFNLVDDFRKLLTTAEEDDFIEYYDEVHADFW